MRNLSIRFKLTLWFSAVLIGIVCVAYLSFLWAGRTVMRSTLRDFLISAVEENADNIRFSDETGDREANRYISFDGGYLEIDLDFMESVSGVRSALYASDGTMLYGEDPISRYAGDIAFAGSRLWNMKVNGTRYDIYDRKLNIGHPDGRLWIRGVVSEADSVTQLKKITRLSAILLPILVVVSGVFGYLIADRLLSPIRKIEKTAELISEGDDLKKRIDHGRNNDEVGRLAKVFNSMLDRLERAFETERRFTSDASHELRTPAAVIIAQTDYILEKDRSTGEYKEALEVIARQGKRMNDLISDMLDYTRMEQGAERYEFEKINLSDLTAETADQMKPISDKGIYLSCDIADDIYIRGNAMLLSRMLMNLISNGYRYGKENGHITVTLEREDDCAVLSVADDGIGIRQDELDRIFDRFYRSDASRSIQGTGLGLSMVKKIAELHGAEIQLSSAPDEGSVFRIIFRKILSF